jgi:DNA-binding NtrC family response regulator
VPQVKVLVVEDDLIVLMVSAESLRDQGFAVIEADTVDGALKLLANDASSITVVFSDIETPGHRDGLGLATLIREQWPSIPVVLTSGRVFPPKGTLPTATYFIGKPYDLDAVADLLRQAIETSST